MATEVKTAIPSNENGEIVLSRAPPPASDLKATEPVDIIPQLLQTGQTEEDDPLEVQGAILGLYNEYKNLVVYVQNVWIPSANLLPKAIDDVRFKNLFELTKWKEMLVAVETDPNKKFQSVLEARDRFFEKFGSIQIQYLISDNDKKVEQIDHKIKTIEEYLGQSPDVSRLQENLKVILEGYAENKRSVLDVAQKYDDGKNEKFIDVINPDPDDAKAVSDVRRMRDEYFYINKSFENMIQDLDRLWIQVVDSLSVNRHNINQTLVNRTTAATLLSDLEKLRDGITGSKYQTITTPSILTRHASLVRYLSARLYGYKQEINNIQAMSSTTNLEQELQAFQYRLLRHDLELEIQVAKIEQQILVTSMKLVPETETELSREFAILMQAWRELDDLSSSLDSNDPLHQNILDLGNKVRAVEVRLNQLDQDTSFFLEAQSIRDKMNVLQSRALEYEQLLQEQRRRRKQIVAPREKTLVLPDYDEWNKEYGGPLEGNAAENQAYSKLIDTQAQIQDLLKSFVVADQQQQQSESSDQTLTRRRRRRRISNSHPEKVLYLGESLANTEREIESPIKKSTEEIPTPTQPPPPPPPIVVIPDTEPAPLVPPPPTPVVVSPPSSPPPPAIVTPIIVAPLTPPPPPPPPPPSLQPSPPRPPQLSVAELVANQHRLTSLSARDLKEYFLPPRFIEDRHTLPGHQIHKWVRLEEAPQVVFYSRSGGGGRRQHVFAAKPPSSKSRRKK
jgi:hypothetical protein